MRRRMSSLHRLSLELMSTESMSSVPLTSMKKAEGQHGGGGSEENPMFSPTSTPPVRATQPIPEEDDNAMSFGVFAVGQSSTLI